MTCPIRFEKAVFLAFNFLQCRVENKSRTIKGALSCMDASYWMAQHVVVGLEYAGIWPEVRRQGIKAINQPRRFKNGAFKLYFIALHCSHIEVTRHVQGRSRGLHDRSLGDRALT